MDKLTFDAFEQQLAKLPETEPDDWDKKMLVEIDAETDNTTMSLEDVRILRERGNKGVAS